MKFNFANNTVPLTVFFRDKGTVFSFSTLTNPLILVYNLQSKKGENALKKTVNDMKIGETAVVTGLGCSGALRRRIIDMGITPGAILILRKAAPLGDPLEINVRGYELSIRRSEAREITVESTEVTP